VSHGYYQVFNIYPDKEKLGYSSSCWGVDMSHKYLILQGTTKLDLVSKYEICRCPDGKGRLLYDYRKKDFVREGKCKLFLLCTIVHTVTFEQKLKRGEIFVSFY